VSREQYFIIFENNEWKISFKDKHYGPYPNQEEAIEAATDAAFAMGEIGIDAQVLTLDRDNAFETKWSYSKDYSLCGR
jgi:Uncharacterized protein conserved in bacteria (DUF2188)